MGIFGLNLIPCSIGNLIAGVIIMAMGFSYFFGTLRQGVLVHFKKQEEPTEEERQYPKLTAVENYRKPENAPPAEADAAKPQTEAPQGGMRARYLPGLLLTILLGSRQSQTRTMVLVGQCRAEGVVRISCREGQWSEIGASQARHDLLGLCKLHVMSTARTDGFMAERHEQHK